MAQAAVQPADQNDPLDGRASEPGMIVDGVHHLLFIAGN
jgi:hypothetical protein